LGENLELWENAGKFLELLIARLVAGDRLSKEDGRREADEVAEPGLLALESLAAVAVSSDDLPN